MNKDIHDSHSRMNSIITSHRSNKNIKNHLTPKQRRKFLKRIFNNDVDDFNKFANLISNIKSRKNAKILMDFYFYKNGVAPDSKDALEFTDVVYDTLEHLIN